MNLREYLDRKGLKHRYFAARVGLSQACFSNYLTGRRGVNPLIAKRIARETKGAVKAASLLRQNVASAAKGSKP